MKMLLKVATKATFRRSVEAIHKHTTHKRWFCSPNIKLTRQQVEELAQQPTTPLTLQQMKSFAGSGGKKRLVSSRFLHNELLVRYARAVQDLGDLPLGISETHTVKQVREKYHDYLEILNSIKHSTTKEDDLAFTAAIRIMKRDASNVVPLVCQGVSIVKEQMGIRAFNRHRTAIKKLNKQLDNFVLSRIGIRMLIGQHVEGLHNEEGRVRMINPEEIVREATTRAITLCEEAYGTAPNVEFVITDSGDDGFMYVASHLHHMVFELVKNSLRASLELQHPMLNRSRKRLTKLNPIMNPESIYLGFAIPQEIESGVSVYHGIGDSSCGDIPPVKIIVSQGEEDLTIKVSDEAGGISRSKWGRLFEYTYSTGSNNSKEIKDFRETFSGGGYGLPIARLFARYFGGELTLLSMEGYGTDVYIQLRRLGSTVECIPGDSVSTIQPLSY